MSNTKENESVVVRNLRPNDLDRVVDCDAKLTGRKRTGYFNVKLAQALADTGVKVSLAAEVDGAFAGFLLARVYYGEFGSMEQSAVLDTIGVNPLFQGRRVGEALLAQLRQNLMALGIPALRTEVSWDAQKLLGFFHHAGFRPAARLVLDLDLAAARERDEKREAERLAV